MQETVPRFKAIAVGLGRKAIPLINGKFRAETTRCSKCDHLLHDGSVRLDFMTDDVNEDEEMRIQTGGSIPVGFNPIPCYPSRKESAYENHTAVQHYSASRHGRGRGEQNQVGGLCLRQRSRARRRARPAGARCGGGALAS